MVEMMSRQAAALCLLVLFPSLEMFIVCGRNTSTNNIHSPSNCYCDDNSENCTNNVCTGRVGCLLNIENNTEGRYKVHRRCRPQLISCLGASEGEYYHCCDGDMCNRCPEYDPNSNNNVPMKIIEEVFQSINCSISFPTTNAPTNLPNRTRATTGQSTSAEVNAHPVWLVPIITLSVILVFLLTLVLFIVYCTYRRYCTTVDVESIGTPSVDESYGLGLSESHSSGALKGCRYLQSKTISKMLHQKERIAKGGFGEVWRAEWDGADYAVKIFRSTFRDSWNREGGIYKTAMLTHPNILHFISMDTKDTNFGLDLWLIFDYHVHGSLLSYLTSNTITQGRALRFLTSIANGLSYLHLPIPTATEDRKPVIAHRDLKSGNILIKEDLTCCIGDLGLAVTELDFAKGKKLPEPTQGTKRYLAPEILAGTIKGRDVQSYVQADVYSFSLIMWEVAKRCQWHGEVPPYEIPYHNVVLSDPTLEDMKKMVVDDHIRPPVDANWKNDEILSVVSRIMQECWRENPDGRLTSSRVKQDFRDTSTETKQSYRTNE